MTQEAMKLALEALTYIHTETTADEDELIDQAITAIKKALAEHAMREAQRLGQEIEQEPVRLQCVTCGTVYADGVPPQVTQPEQEPVAWLLTDKNINSLQVDSIQRLINRLKHAHQTDLCVRINGQYEWFQADWLKDMVRVAPPQRTQPNDIDLFWRAVTTPEKWVGLTAEEVLQCWERAHEPGNEGLINAIRMADEVEQALKEKSCG